MSRPSCAASASRCARSFDRRALVATTPIVVLVKGSPGVSGSPVGRVVSVVVDRESQGSRYGLFGKRRRPFRTRATNGKPEGNVSGP